MSDFADKSTAICSDFKELNSITFQQFLRLETNLFRPIQLLKIKNPHCCNEGLIEESSKYILSSLAKILKSFLLFFHSCFG
jgi:hypothetical protein